MKNRTEKDLLSEVEIPGSAYWGAHTQRAVNNYAFGYRKTSMALVRAMALVKKACAAANKELGYLDGRLADAVMAACDEIAAGGLRSEFPVDALQGGAGTSTNMNLNEVLANRAIEILGGEKGNYNLVNPLAHVNLHQSTNDVYPTALKIACILKLRTLSEAVAGLQGALQAKEKEFADIVKIARTQLQEAVPVTLGAEFGAFAECVSRDRWRVFKCEERLRVVNIGGTAVGTGMCAPRNYIFLVIEKLREITNLGLSRGENLMGETANADAFVEVSGILKAHASNIIKISGDLRLMNLLGEIALPSLAAGSSIMPGKVNPVMCEAAVQAGIRVMANDFITAEAASRGTFQISEFLPLLADAMLESLELMNNADALLKTHVLGIAAIADNCRRYAQESDTIVTAFVPYIGYAKAEQLVCEFQKTGKSNLKEFLAERLGRDLVERVLSPQAVVRLGYEDDSNA